MAFDFSSAQLSAPNRPKLWSVRSSQVKMSLLSHAVGWVPFAGNLIKLLGPKRGVELGSMRRKNQTRDEPFRGSSGFGDLWGESERRR